jgi:acyl CoA:acetate/3-ketoacid CoA transferase alpha subunit
MILLDCKTWKGTETGNLIFQGTARNFNACMAECYKITHYRGKNFYQWDL